MSLWANLCADDVRALRACCSPLRDAVDAQVGALDHATSTADVHVLSAATCARLDGVNTVTLRSMACVRAMLVELPGAFPRLQSVRLLLSKNDGVIEDAADYQAIASTAHGSPTCVFQSASHTTLLCRSTWPRCCLHAASWRTWRWEQSAWPTWLPSGP
ncbi:hypothetical protein FOA52_007293 [Chlamydomonas sp. UWO 241]|nr:hypothetical protein FOA52_007293 [Chlamydomonas sp. UWO 241]